jgi:ABC-type polysaccharide/polyol phosphate export permease
MNKEELIFKFNKIIFLSKTNFKNSIREAALGEYFWVIFAFFLLVCSKTFIFSELFNNNPLDYFFYLSVSLSIWQYIYSSIVSGSDILFRNKLLLNYQITQSEWQLIKFCEYSYHFCIKILFILITDLYFNYLKLTPLFVSILVVMIVCFLSIKIISILGVFFRDFCQFLRSIMNIFFFITPVIWLPIDLSKSITDVLKYNPFYYVLSTSYPSYKIEYIFFGFGGVIIVLLILLITSVFINFLKIKIKRSI